jgi:hypothetical protein
VVRTSSSVLPSTNMDEPRNRRRGVIIGRKQYAFLSS